MNGDSRNAIGYVCALLLVNFVSLASAQQVSSPEQQDSEPVQQYSDRLRGSRLVGSGDSLAIEMADGELIPYAPRCGHLQPVARGGLIKVDCSTTDGPTHYFDEATRVLVESCSFWFPDLQRCPPKQWPIEVSGCDDVVPQGITGTWRFFALPSAYGLTPVSGGWVMKLADGSMSLAFAGGTQIQRSYTVVKSGDRRYTLELRDGRSETTVISIELAPCGMFVEGDRQCDAFCENIVREFRPPTEAQLRTILGNSVSEAMLQQILEVAKSEEGQRPRPLFAEGAYFRAVPGG